MPRDSTGGRIVGIHGAFHQFWGPNQVKSRWLPAIQDELAHADGSRSDSPSSADQFNKRVHYDDQHDDGRATEPR